MIERVRRVDAVLLLLQSAVNDARMLNIARTLRDAGKSVALVAYGSEHDRQTLARENIELLAIHSDRDGRLFKRWPAFLLQARLLLRGINAATCWAEDVFTLPLAAGLARRSGGRLIYDSRELYFALGTLQHNDLRQKVIQATEARFYPRCDAVMVSGPLDADELLKRYGGGRAEVVMNLPPLNIVAPNKSLHARFGLADHVNILVYQGGVFRAKGLDLAVRALQYLPDCALCIIGDGPFELDIRRLAAELKLEDRVLFTGRLPYDELPRWTAAADIGLALIEATTLSYRLALPNKMFEYCMAGIPTLATDLPAMRAAIEDHGIGALIKQDATARATAEVVKDMLQTPALHALRAACAAAREKLNWQAQAERVLRLQNDDAPQS